MGTVDPKHMAGFVLELIANDRSQTQHIVDQFWMADLAEKHWLRDGVEWALSLIPYGGTTADYDAGIGRLCVTLYPSREIKDWYLAQAEGAITGRAVKPWPGYRLSGGAM